MAMRIAGSRTARGLAIAAGLSALAAFGGGIAAGPASAAVLPRGTNCAPGNHCVFWTDIDSARHSYFNSDGDFSNDTFNERNVSGSGLGATVNNNVWSASNSTTGGFESHYYDGTNGTGAFLFCVNPGHEVNTANGGGLPSNLRDRASSLVLRGTTPVHCY